MKADREHVVPLCDEALEIVTKMKDWKREGSDLLFPSVRSQLSDVAVNKVLHSVAPDVTVHGFRSSFRIWGAETTVTPSAVLELALAHVNTNQVEAAYQRSDLLDRRRELMNAWSSYCNSKGNVIQLVNRNNKIQ
jgi:integrase